MSEGRPERAVWLPVFAGSVGPRCANTLKANVAAVQTPSACVLPGLRRSSFCSLHGDTQRLWAKEHCVTTCASMVHTRRGSAPNLFTMKTSEVWKTNSTGDGIDESAVFTSRAG